MGYRKLERPKPNLPRMRNVQSTTTPGEIFIQNGIAAYFAFPCWYIDQEPPRHATLHDTTHHDHIGHPEPRRPDASCQIVQGHHMVWEPHKNLLELSNVWPIHLLEEGYQEAELIFDDPPDGLKSKSSIDTVDDWVVRTEIQCGIDEAIKEQVDIPYALFVFGHTDEEKDVEQHIHNIVTKGVLHVLPGPYNPEWHHDF